MTRSALILVVTVVVVAASYYAFSRLAADGTPEPIAKPAAAPNPNATTTAAPRNETALASASAATLPRTIAIVIDKSHPPAPSDVIRVAKDDPVTLTVTSDRAGHVEVHGYRKEVAVEPGKAATLSFKADRTGRFPIDLHAEDGAHVEVTALEVMPR